MFMRGGNVNILEEQLSYLEHFFRLIKRYLAAVYLQDIYSNTNDNI